MVELLPSEVWEEIFGWLDTVQDLCACTATCRSWAALCWRERHHVRLRVTQPKAAIEASAVEEERHQEERAALSDRRASPEDMAIELVARRCGKLQRLDVHGTGLNVGAQAVTTLLASCTRLTQLHLDRCSTSMYTDAITAAAQHPSGAGSRLTALTLCGMRRLTDAKLAESFGKFSSLRSLSLESCTQLTSSGLVTLAALCPQLTALCLHGCYRVKDQGVIAVVKMCSRLENLNLQGLAIITDLTVRALAEHHPTSLRSLNIWGCPRVSDAAMSLLLDNCTSLEKLVAKFCSGATLDSTFEHLAHTTKIRYLDIQGLVIGDETLNSISTYLSSTLSVIDVRDCPNLTARGMAHMIASCTRITILRLRSPNVDDACVVAAAQSLPRLYTLDLQKCVNVTAEGIRALASDASVCRRSLGILNVLGLPLLRRADVEELLAALPMVKARTDFDVRPYEQR